MVHLDKYGVAYRDEDAARQWRFDMRLLALTALALLVAALLAGCGNPNAYGSAIECPPDEVDAATYNAVAALFRWQRATEAQVGALEARVASLEARASAALGEGDGK